MSGFEIDTRAFDILSDGKGAISGFIIHVGKIDLKIQAYENKEADKRTSTALLVWLSKRANEIAELLKNYGATYEGIVNINIFPCAEFEKEIGNLFPYGGLTLEQFKSEVLENGFKPMLAQPNEIYLVVRDDLEKEYFKDTNSMEQIVFGTVVWSLLLLLCHMDEKKATPISVKFAFNSVPLTPKIPTHALALAIMGAKKK